MLFIIGDNGINQAIIRYWLVCKIGCLYLQKIIMRPVCIGSDVTLIYGYQGLISGVVCLGDDQRIHSRQLLISLPPPQADSSSSGTINAKIVLILFIIDCKDNEKSANSTIKSVANTALFGNNRIEMC